VSNAPSEGHDQHRDHLPWVVGIIAVNLALWLIDQSIDATPAAAVVSVASGIALMAAGSAWSWPRSVVVPLAVVLLALGMLDLLDNDLLPRIRL
jgi:hypothetical protein